MGVELNYITAVNHSQDTSTAIEIFNSPPPSQALPVAVDPGRIVGYYNQATDSIQLYVADANGLRYVPVKLYVP